MKRGKTQDFGFTLTKIYVEKKSDNKDDVKLNFKTWVFFVVD